MKPALKKIGRQLIFSFLIFSLFLPLLAKPAAAFSTPSLKGGYFTGFEGAVFKTQEMNLQSFVNETFKAVISSIRVAITGCLSCEKEEADQYPGLFASTSGLIAGVYGSPPASGVHYLAYLGNKIGVVKPAYAQETGTGFQILETVREVWIAFRNITYLFLVIIIVFVGFAIMFRLKINPQTVVSLQSALPRIVLVLILITFSYAIVGFMIDLMLVLSLLINRIFRNIPLVGDDSIATIIDPIAGALGIVDVFFDLGTNPSWAFQLFSTHVFFLLIGPFISFFFLSFLAPPLGVIALIVVAILSAIALIRILWLLIKTYALIIIGTVFGPFQILVGALPSSSAIGSWLKNTLANVAVMPTVVAMIYLASYLMLKGSMEFFADELDVLKDLILYKIPGTEITLPPGLSLPVAMSQLGDIFSAKSILDIVTALILPITGIAILWMTPKAADMIKAFISGQPFQYGTAITAVIPAPIREAWDASKEIRAKRYGAGILATPGAIKSAAQTGYEIHTKGGGVKDSVSGGISEAKDKLESAITTQR